MENREVFAGNVTAWVDGSGTLQIRGDNYANTIEVREVAHNTIDVVGYSTGVNGYSTRRFYVSGDNLNVNLGGGNDWLSVVGARLKNLNVDMGAGADIALVSNSTVYGAGWSTNITLGTASQNDVDNLYLLNDRFYGNFYSSSGAGNDYNSYENVQIDGGLWGHAGAGNDRYRWVNSRYGFLGAWTGFDRRV